MPKHIDTATARALIQRARRGIEAQGRAARLTGPDGFATYITSDGSARSTLGHLLTPEQAREAQARNLDPWRDRELAEWVLGADTPEGRRLVGDIEDAHDDNFTHDEAVRDIVEDLDRLEAKLCARPGETLDAAQERLRSDSAALGAM